MSLRFKILFRLLIGSILLVCLVCILVIHGYGNLRPPSWNNSEATAQQGRFVILDWTGFSKLKTGDRSIGNCFVTRNKAFLQVSDAVAITNRRQLHFRDFPKLRHEWQRWVWIIDESPFHPFSGNDFNFSMLNGLFNWTMTYRTNSDVHIPYGWITKTFNPEPIPEFIGKQAKLAVAVMSNCGSGSVHNARYKYVLELQKHAPVDVFGSCSGIPCDGYSNGQQTGPCPKVKEYLFYLAFENGNCREYITEKSFSHGFDMGPVPVVMGAPKDDYIRITPPRSFIHTADFETPKQLGNYLKSVAKNHTQYMEFHQWRRNYNISYRIQFMNDESLWDSLCTSLAKDKGETSIYTNLAKYWTKADCEPYKN